MSEIVRSPAGKFLPGTASGNPRGRPRRETELEYHTALVGAVSLADWIEIIYKAVEKAKHGDRFAREFLASYLIGRPVETVDFHTEQQRQIVLLLPGQHTPEVDGGNPLESDFDNGIGSNVPIS